MTDIRRAAIRHAEKSGWKIGATHKFNSFRTDEELFGFVSFIAISDKQGIVAIKTCHLEHLEQFVTEIMMDHAEVTKKWLANDAYVQVWGWKKVGGKNLLKAVGIFLEDDAMRAVVLYDQTE